MWQTFCMKHVLQANDNNSETFCQLSFGFMGMACSVYVAQAIKTYVSISYSK